MSQWWILILITLNVDGTITTQKQDRFNYRPSCQIAAEGRQLLITGSRMTNKVFVCLNEFKNEPN